jgi:radical SAM protein
MIETIDLETEPVAAPRLSAVDFGKTPFVAIWETTRACDLACHHCRAEALSRPLPGELSTEEGFAVLDELASMGTPICVLSGGDPAKRIDLCRLVRHGKNLGMRMATIPAGTPLLTRDLVSQLKDAGLAQMALSLDGPTPEVHDTFRNTPGAFDLTLQGAIYAAEIGLPLQINTVLSAYNEHYFSSIAELVRLLDVVFWEVFFLVPMGRGKELGQMNAQQFEALFARLADFSQSVKFIVKITEAPHYRRYLMQHRRPAPHGDRPVRLSGLSFASYDVRQPKPFPVQLPAHMTRDFGPGGSIGLAPKGVNSGNGHLFINYRGDICPSGFLPLPCGNVRRDSIAEVYRSHRVFRELRDPDLLKGKCGICEFRNICGGSRARAFAMTGDYLAEEPFCAYQPKRLTCPEEYASFT